MWLFQPIPSGAQQLSATLGTVTGTATLTLDPIVLASTAAVTGLVPRTVTASLTLDPIVLVSYANASRTTTVETLRDYIISIIGGLVPRSLSGDRFRKYRNEGGGRFHPWCEANPAGAFRRYQVRDTGAYSTASVSTTDLEERYVEFITTVAYPQNNRTGRQAALDRDDVMRQDQRKIETAIGLLAWGDFVVPYATWIGGSTVRERGQAVDYLVVRQTMRYFRAYS